MSKRISVVIPNHNKGYAIKKCLEAAFSSDYDNFEVIVVDDCSTDNSLEIIKKFPCKLIRLEKNSGASRARNTGAQNSSGEILFFIDADCLLQKDSLAMAQKAVSTAKNTVIGGTYTKIPYDDTFFSTFQSSFINYSETKKKEPDYIATHAMVITSEVFNKAAGFSENFLPIIEDVEFSHRLRRLGFRLKMDSGILVRHIFNFTLMKSLKNAFRKASYWTIYSLKNKDIFSDSGAASIELKANVISFFLNLLFVVLFFYYVNTGFLILILSVFAVNLFLNQGLLKAFYIAKGLSFSLLAALYYTLVYPIPVGAGALAGLIKRLKY